MRHGRLFSPTRMAGAAATCLTGAIALSMSPAQAKSATVTGTFSATGVTSSACSTDIGGNAIYVKPGNGFKAKTSIVGINALGAGIPGAIQGLAGTLGVTHGSRVVYSHTVGGRPATVGTLPRGTYAYKFVAKYVSTKVSVPLVGTVIKRIPLRGGAQLTWTGNIFVTSAKDQCGISVSLPSTVVSVSATGLPPVKVTLPGVNGPTLPDPLTSVGLPHLPRKFPHAPGSGGSGGGHHGGHGGAPPSGNVSDTPRPLTVPEQVMPHADAVGGTDGLAPPGTASGGGGYVAPPPSTTVTDGGAVAPPDETPATKAVDPSSRSRLGGRQLPVLLAIAAILALVSVTGVYAKLRLLRR